MDWNSLGTILPNIAGSLPAIGAYIVLVIGALFFWQRKQTSADWQRLLDSIDRNSAAATENSAPLRFRRLGT
jgi:hypothetical protein